MRFVEFKNNLRKTLVEAEARIQHAEDFLFFDGSAGAVRVLNSLEKLEQGVEDVHRGGGGGGWIPIGAQ